MSISPDLRIAGRVKKTAVEKAVAAAAGAAFRECLPRLKDDKAIGIADIDASEEFGRKQAVYPSVGGNPSAVRKGYEGDLMEGKSTDPHVLRGQEDECPRHSICAKAVHGRTQNQS